MRVMFLRPSVCGIHKVLVFIFALYFTHGSVWNLNFSHRLSCLYRSRDYQVRRFRRYEPRCGESSSPSRRLSPPTANQVKYLRPSLMDTIRWFLNNSANGVGTISQWPWSRFQHFGHGLPRFPLAAWWAGVSVRGIPRSLTALTVDFRGLDFVFLTHPLRAIIDLDLS
ncbi:uncharacterized protein BDW47DRAFT_104178 [Aspergillus candidus]|uniref:Uncharacterized protein n=1 Tax=Aspergillus candidus TaxID=41067 RepID=A0A2I2FEI7_ASPCN|nr:hypothetical protein BDW47DRAFT_104178 [Aspergillus candidus]PLB39051.1 hypothetical protein BDW47DRAFT_104178 [Aspergillus candidus]